jgi:arylsulfatase A
MHPTALRMAKTVMTFLAAVAGFLLTASRLAAAEKLNVVLILADDLGWTDVACYGSDLHETPHLDRLAKEGMRFTQNYAACTVCSPTRSALLTGKYPARTHITDWIPGRMPANPKLLVPEWTKYLPLEEVTIGEAFKAAGYVTGTIGKWHLGDGEFVSEKQGFDVNIAGTNAGAPPSFIAPWKIPTITEGKDGDYLTDRLGEEAAAFIEQHKAKPFFLYLPHYAVHTPIQGRADLVAKYEAKLKLKPGLTHANAAYAAMMESLDAAVGRVLAKLDEHKLTESTMVVFTSDNGGRVPTTSNKPLRVGKGSAYEGGLRVPLIVKWPGVTKPGGVSDQVTITMDLFPTLLEAAGVNAPESTSKTGAAGRDGISLVPVLRGSGGIERQELFWHYPHHQHYQLGGSMPFAAIRSGDLKLIEFYNDSHVELYNLREHIGEQKDLAAAQPEKAKALRERLHAWQAEVGAQMATPNPAFDASKPEFDPASPFGNEKGKGKDKRKNKNKNKKA